MAHACPVCAAPVAARRPGEPGAPRLYCSRSCNERARRARLAAQRVAQPPGNGSCITCGADISATKAKKYCSVDCANIAYGRRLPAPLAPRICALPECGKEFQPKRDGQLCCCERHGRLRSNRRWDKSNPESWDERKERHHRRRALRKGATVGEPFSLADIRERDGNRCHLCRRPISTEPYPHPLSGSLDHVIPLTKGGMHERSNVRLAHLICNVKKGNRGGNEQLLLIG